MARLQCVRPRHRERAVGPRAGGEGEWISRLPKIEEWPVDLPPPSAMVDLPALAMGEEEDPALSAMGKRKRSLRRRSWGS